MRSRPVVHLVLLALLLVPSTALAQSAGDDQYSDPVGTTSPPSPPQSTPGSSGAGSGSGSGAGSSPIAESPSSSSGTGTIANNDTSGDSGSNTLPATGLPVAILLIVGLLFTLSGRGLSRASREPAPDPHAGRSPDVPASSPVARAARRRSRSPSSH